MINAKLLVVWASALPLISSFAQEITQAEIRELEALTREALTASPTEGPDGALQGWVDTLNPLNFTNQLYQIWGNNEKLKKGYIDRGLLFEPHTKFTPETWRNFYTYFAGESASPSKWEIISSIYGGEPLTRYLANFDFDIANKETCKVDIKIRHGDYPKEPIEIEGMNFAQLLVESSQVPAVDSNWSKIDPQTRVEICQNELSRWSVIVKSDKPVEEWGGQRVPPGLRIRNDDWVDKIEIVNNCTTSKGFELKMKIGPTTYHSSFVIPPAEYRRLCQEQAGAWARQGWSKQNEEQPSGLIDPSSGPYFSDIYQSEKHSLPEIQFDLNRYRTITKDQTPQTLPILVQYGEIDYRRWGKPTDGEYYQKPWVRHLVMHPTESRFITPPSTYREILEDPNRFRLPDFEESGIYNVLKPTTKTHYGELAKLSQCVIKETESGLLEISLTNPDAFAADLDLHRIVLGNISMDLIPTYPDYYTFNRFCYNPRPTTSYYDHAWKPAHKTGEEAPYAFVLGRTRDDDPNTGVFIQPESWGIERCILSFADADRSVLVVDLMSFERIVPVWQGIITFPNTSES
ncbi:MAG: hypothetical protein AAF191_03380 [Verrucomicrobiota bacterium]